MPEWIYIALFAHAVVIVTGVISVLRAPKDPMAMVSWIFAITTVPVFGITLYGLLAANRIERRAYRRRRRITHILSRFTTRTPESTQHAVEPVAEELPGNLLTVERLGFRLAQMPATMGNEVHVYQEADATYAALADAIHAAEHHVHLEYYIWQPDQTGRYFRDLLIKKARAGVECRLLLDAFGCWRLTRQFTGPLLEAGCQLAYFMPLWPLRRSISPHLRNHRKIAVIDGATGFVGSQNIGDEYRGLKKRLSPWYDAHLRVRGPAASFLQQTFAEDWALATQSALDDDSYFPVMESRGSSAVQILPTGPERDYSQLGQMLFAAVSTANDSVRVVTPYFVPSEALRTALIYARHRGVRVQLVLAARSDSPLVLWAGRSFYPELVDAGIEIYEFAAGMLHSKIMVVDERWCMIGSANMDVRSFRLNFEVTALIYDKEVTRRVAADIDRFRADSRRVRRRDVAHRRLGQQLCEGGARLFAPLL